MGYIGILENKMEITLLSKLAAFLVTYNVEMETRVVLYLGDHRIIK